MAGRKSVVCHSRGEHAGFIGRERVAPGVLRQPPATNEVPRGGPFAALEAPELLAEELRAFVRPLSR